MKMLNQICLLQIYRKAVTRNEAGIRRAKGRAMRAPTIIGPYQEETDLVLLFDQHFFDGFHDLLFFKSKHQEDEDEKQNEGVYTRRPAGKSASVG